MIRKSGTFLFRVDDSQFLIYPINSSVYFNVLCFYFRQLTCMFRYAIFYGTYERADFRALDIIIWFCLDSNLNLDFS